jgi:hypothetical protein
MWSPFRWSRLSARLRRPRSLGILYEYFLGDVYAMPSLVHVLIGLGGTALVVGAMALWQHAPQQPSSLSGGFTSAPSPRMVGNSALSHGGPSPNSKMATGFAAARFQIGQKLIVAATDDVSRTATLLPLPPNHATSAPTFAKTQIVSSGTVVFVSGIQAIEPVTAHTEQYYQVTMSDGKKGWLPEHALRPATNRE